LTACAGIKSLVSLQAGDQQHSTYSKDGESMLTFEWHPQKAESNTEKHDVSFEEASTVFQDPLSLTINDPLHSTGEVRMVQIGISHHNRLLVVVHTERGDNIRIISARKANRKERGNYESDE